MAYATPATRRAADQRRYLQRYAEGGCVRCPRPRLYGHTLCRVCNGKENARGVRRGTLATFQQRLGDLADTLAPCTRDRRQHGEAHAALRWALTQALWRDRTGASL